jgi:hypothetical protein
MNFRGERAETLMPLFAGALGSLIFCAVIAVSYGDIFRPGKPAVVVVVPKIEEETDDDFSLSAFERKNDPVLPYFRNSEYREWVIDFFTSLCSSREIAQAILDNTDEFDVPPALAFALSWEESRFNPRAINRQNRDGSVDRGLFQLNSRSFPDLELAAFFDIKSNARYGVSHLRHCIDSADSEISALAMYNAGTGRVRSQGAPEVTLNYVSRILENRRIIESRFHARLIKEEETRINADDQALTSRTVTAASPL